MYRKNTTVLFLMAVLCIGVPVFGDDKNDTCAQNELEMQEDHIIKGACYYKIHGHAECQVYRTPFAGIYRRCGIKECLEHRRVQKLLNEHSRDEGAQVITFHDRRHKIVAIMVRGNKREQDNSDITRFLDPLAKPEAVRGVIAHHMKLGRTLFLYDAEGEVLLYRRYENGTVQISETDRRLLGLYVDMSKCKKIEDRY